jgi:hypothetical protein
MDDSDGFILRTGETWKADPKCAGVYLEQLTYVVFYPGAERDLNLPDNFRELVTMLAAPNPPDYSGFSLQTGRFKIIYAQSPLLFAE